MRPHMFRMNIRSFPTRAMNGIVALAVLMQCTAGVFAQNFHRAAPTGSCCPPYPVTPPQPSAASPLGIQPTQPGTGQPGTGQPGQTPNQQPPQQADQQQDQQQQDNQDTGRAGATGGGEFATANIIGDLNSGRNRTVTRFVPIAPGSSTLVPLRINVPATLASFKIAENENPRPQDRVFFTFNYFNNVNDRLNTRFGNGVDIGHVDAQRILGGFEKTFMDGDASIGLRVPVNFLTIGQGTDSGLQLRDLGDISMIFKGILYDNREQLLSGGIVVTLPTGPTGFAGANSIIQAPRGAFLQPYLGFINFFNRDLYVQGFTSFDFPTNEQDTTLYLADISLGYFLTRNTDPTANLKSIVGIAEVHANIPLSNRNIMSDQFFTPDVVVLTQGLSFNFSRTTFTVAVAEPITGFKPFDVEAVAQLNIRY